MRRDAQGRARGIGAHAERFHTDHVDLYQFHAVGSMEDVDKILAPGGAAETFFAARRKARPDTSASQLIMRPPRCV